MDEPFDLPVSYRGKGFAFCSRLLQLAYTHRGTGKAMVAGFLMWASLMPPAFTQSKKNNDKTGEGSWQDLLAATAKIGEPNWRPMLKYVAALHQRSTHPATYPFTHEWEEIGPGYFYGPAFGHWDIVHQSIDVLAYYPQHALFQLLNDIKNQEANGLIPGSIYMPGTSASGVRTSVSWNKNDQGHPPVWMVAVQDYVDLTKDKRYLVDFFNALQRQLAWFENSRKAEGEGFFYNDILLKKWESGVDEGIRFDDATPGRFACIDATCHVYLMYDYASRWAKELGCNASLFDKRKTALAQFIQNDLYSPADGIFYDSWAIKNPALRHTAFENLWPLIVGVATKQQADKLIDKYILNPQIFLTEHPLATVGRSDPKFELRMWRGPAWNSMTYWVARGCIAYGRKDAARTLLTKALNTSAAEFEKTGTIWEFYHPLGGDQQAVKRKPQTKRDVPCTDYLGHNPLIAMALMYDAIR